MTQINQRVERRPYLGREFTLASEDAMFGMFSSKPARLFIDRGTVRCPVRAGDVEVGACLTCQWLLEIDEDGATPFVRCEPVSVRPSRGTTRER